MHDFGDHDDTIRRELVALLDERMKELEALHRAAAIVLDGGPLEARLGEVVALLPPAMQHPDVATARIQVGEVGVATPGHAHTPWMVFEPVLVGGYEAGRIEIAYHAARPAAHSGPFLAEELALLGSLGRMLGTALARRAVQEDLREANERMVHAFEAASMGVWELDVPTMTTRWSASLARLLGITGLVEGPLGGHRDLVHPDDRDRVFERIRRAVDGEDDLDGLELRMQRVDGAWRHFAARSKLIPAPPARPTKIVTALIDVTERRALESSLRQAQKIEALGQVAAGVAHDFNNVLMVLMSGGAMLAEELPEGELRDIAIGMTEAAERGAALTRQLLAFSRKASFEPRRVDVGEVVHRLAGMLARLGKPARVRLELGEAPLEIWADPTQIEQVLMNLVVNARDAMAERGGEILVSVRPRPAAEGDRPAREGTLAVRDQGAGIPPEVLPHIFEPFFTTKGPGKGTGLGLAVVAEAARQWGARVEVDSAPERGTTFAIHVPLHDRA